MEQKKTFKQRFRKPRHSVGVANCENCGKEFFQYYERHRFCCKKCWNQGQKNDAPKQEKGEVACEACGKVFMQTKPNQTCCSRQCRKVVSKSKYIAQSKDPFCKYCGSEKPPNKMRTESCGKPECEEKRRERLEARKQREKEAIDTPSIKEQEDIANLRRALGLPEIKDGNVECLVCKSVFYSENVKGNRVCRVCKENETRLEVASVYDTFICRTGWNEREA